MLTEPKKITIAFAEDGTKNVIPNDSQIGITDGAASYETGFPPLTMTLEAAGGVPPFGQDHNGILYEISDAVRYVQSGAIYEYDSDYATAIGGYPLGARVLRSDGLGYWRNELAGNETDPEGVSAANWIPDTVAGKATVPLVSSAVTLSKLEAACSIIQFTGTLTADVIVTFPTYIKTWSIINSCAGAFSVTCKTAAGSGATLAAGDSLVVSGDGTNIVAISSTISEATTTTLGVVRLATNAEAAALANASKVITPNTLLQAFYLNQSIAENGYLKIPGGLILQWAKGATATSQSPYNIIFPIPFPNACLNVQITTNNPASGAGANYDIWFQTISWTKTEVRVIFQNTDGHTNGFYPFIFAIGY